MKKRTVAILIFENVELLDFAGPYEVFISSSVRDLVQAFTVAETTDLLTCRNGLIVKPDYNLNNCPPFNILVVPGGRGTETVINKPQVIEWIKEKSQQNELTTSVCTGSFLLAKAGLLDGKSATTHWGSIQLMRERFPHLDVQENIRWVEDGNIISSAGVSAGIDMALHILERLYDKATADKTARGIEYDHWK